LSQWIDVGEFQALARNLVAQSKKAEESDPMLGERIAKMASQFKGDRPTAFYEGMFVALSKVLAVQVEAGLLGCHPEIMVDLANLVCTTAQVYDRASRRGPPPLPAVR